jgi:hypothetical protein
MQPQQIGAEQNPHGAEKQKGNSPGPNPVFGRKGINRLWLRRSAAFSIDGRPIHFLLLVHFSGFSIGLNSHSVKNWAENGSRLPQNLPDDYEI